MTANIAATTTAQTLIIALFGRLGGAHYPGGLTGRLRASVGVAVAKSNDADAPVGQVIYSWPLLSSRFVKSRPAGNPIPGA